MAKRLYVGNLPWSVSSADLQTMFAEFGEVQMAEVVSDRDTGRSRGFGFVTMETDEGSAEAISQLHDKDFKGRPLVVNEARERESRPARSGGGYGGGGGGYGGGGRRRDY